MWCPMLKTTARSFALPIKHADILHHRFIQETRKLSTKLFVSVRLDSLAVKPLGGRKLFEKPQSTVANIIQYQRRNFAPDNKSAVTGIHENISAFQSKKRVARRRETLGAEGLKLVQGYTTAEEYDLEALHSGLIKQDLYLVKKLMTPGMEEDNSGEWNKNSDQPDVLYAIAKYSVEDEPREIFFFREGSAVLWNVREEEAANILAFVKPFEQNSYDKSLVLSEKEYMPYKYLESNRTKIHRGAVVLPQDRANVALEKYAISDAISSSVKLGVWEASLECYISSIEFVTDDLKLGNKIRMSREDVLRKHGELFALRHMINLSSDLLDTPDFYWEHDDLENVYQDAVSYFSIGRRTRVMNEKLNHCVELVELISSHLNDKHHVRLEWMIIVLIMVEVVFEILHFSERLLTYRTEEEEYNTAEVVQKTP